MPSTCYYCIKNLESISANIAGACSLERPISIVFCSRLVSCPRRLPSPEKTGQTTRDFEEKRHPSDSQDGTVPPGTDLGPMSGPLWQGLLVRACHVIMHNSQFSNQSMLLEASSRPNDSRSKYKIELKLNVEISTLGVDYCLPRIMYSV